MQSLASNHKILFSSNFSNSNIEIFMYQIEQYIDHYINFGKICNVKDMLVENLQNLKIKLN
jgi:hypothetical protein